MSINKPTGIRITATTDAEHTDDNKVFEHAEISLCFPLHKSDEKKFNELKDNLINNLIDIYSLETKMVVDVNVTYDYFQVNAEVGSNK